MLEERFNQLDKNHDGQLTAEEAGNAEWFKRLDRAGKGYLTLAEVRALARLLTPRDGGGANARGNGGDTARTLPGEPEPTASSSPLASAPNGIAAAEEPLRVGPKILRAAERGVGRLAPDLAFTDFDGKAGRLSDFKSRPALVIAFTSTSCPITQKYAPELARISKEFSARGVAFLLVNPIASDSPASLRAAITGHGFAGRYVHDREGKLAAALDAQTTAEVFVLDAARTVVFRGAIDDQYGLGYALAAPRRAFLREALEAVLAGRAPAAAATEAPGCALESASESAPALASSATTPAAATAAAPAPTITFHNRISRIVQANCLECHRAGGLGPFSLESYADVKSHAAMMHKQVARGAMPPWFAAPFADGGPSHWANDRSLAPADKADLLAWLAGDKPLGDPADAPLPRVFPSGWEIGAPDVVLELPRPVAIKAEGVMPYQVHTVTTSFPEDRWVRAFEIRPTAREAVHHVIVRVHTRGAKVANDEGETGGARDGFFAAYVPGNSFHVFPEGFAKKLPAGATVSFQMHYTPTGKATTDRTRLGLLF
ncbi:MAG: hypothetical protein RLZZ15_2738, partial [Verrucomicrobiota bacterium]